MKERMRRMNHLLKKEISKIIFEDMNDPRCKLITVTGVRVSNDLRFAKVFCSIMGSGDERARTMEALEGAKGFVQHKLTQTVDLRFIPQLRFTLDETLDNSYHIMDLLQKIKNEEKPLEVDEEVEDGK